MSEIVNVLPASAEPGALKVAVGATFTIVTVAGSVADAPDGSAARIVTVCVDEESLFEAIGIARRLGAEPLTRRVAGRLRELGMSVSHGPSPRSSRAADRSAAHR